MHGTDISLHLYQGLAFLRLHCAGVSADACSGLLHGTRELREVLVSIHRSVNSLAEQVEGFEVRPPTARYFSAVLKPLISLWRMVSCAALLLA